MKNPALKDTKSPIDARLISLYSRDTHSGIRPLTESGQYYTFNYYDAIEVEEVKCENTSVLYAAYKQTIEKWENHGTPYNAKQFLLAFIDVLENGEEGYSEKEIKEFWDNTEFPLFFVTMINISNHDDIENVLNKIKNLFPPKQYLPYLTFDHCDIILFSRSNSFADYASQIFKLNYEGLPVIADSITLCTIPSKVNLDIDEKFGIYLRIGVRDYAAAEKFNKKIREYYQKKSQRRAIKQYRLLGRNDIGFYNPIATLKWLSEIKDIAVNLKCESDNSLPWYTTYAVSVLIPPRGKINNPNVLPPIDSGLVKSKMDDAYNKFCKAYITKCNQLSLAVDGIWLRWLKESSDLAISFIGNRLAMDLGTCLVPQFLDLFSYNEMLFRSDNMDVASWETVQRSFADFFSNIFVLIDSMNHSNRQFVQVPSFHSVSFEMPPKIMAYFTAMAHELVNVFRDSSDTNSSEIKYGVTISPKFVDMMDVSSLALQNILPKEQLISINISERSLYTLRHTTGTMAHEISHFVGEKNRCRTYRRECIMKCVTVDFLLDLLDNVQISILGKHGILNNEIELACDTLTHVQRCADSIWKVRTDILIPIGIYLREVEEAAINLPKMIDSFAALEAIVLDWLYQVLIYDENNKSCSLIRKLKSEKHGLAAKCLSEISDDTRSILKNSADEIQVNEIKYEIRDEVSELLNLYIQTSEANALKNKTESGQVFSPMHICYMFSETFADLQAILLFKLTWQQYCDLLKGEQDMLPEDVPPRMLAIVMTLEKTGYWEDLEKSSTDSVFSNIIKAKNLNLEHESANLAELGFNSNLTHYLVDYLCKCKEEIESSFRSEQNSELVKKLRKVYESLSDETSVLELQKSIMNFIADYRAKLSQ